MLSIVIIGLFAIVTIFYVVKDCKGCENRRKKLIKLLQTRKAKRR